MMLLRKDFFVFKRLDNRVVVVLVNVLFYCRADLLLLVWLDMFVCDGLSDFFIDGRVVLPVAGDEVSDGFLDLVHDGVCLWCSVVGV